VSDQSVVLAVASYSSLASADRDVRAVRDAHRERGLDQVALAVLEKGDDGTLRVERHDQSPRQLVRGGALLGGVLLGSALTVVAAPVGIMFLARVVVTAAEWLGVSAIVGHFWHNIPKDQLRQMSDLLEAGQAAVLVVAVNLACDDIAARLPHATECIVADGSCADFVDEFSRAVGEASATN
jgi:hypothetical protein